MISKTDNFRDKGLRNAVLCFVFNNCLSSISPFYGKVILQIALKLSDLEKQVIELMSGDVKPTIEELCEKINRKKSTTYNLLKSLCDKGLLK